MDKEMFELLNKEVDKLETIKLLRDIFDQLVLINNRLSALDNRTNDYTFYGGQTTSYPPVYRHNISDTSTFNGGTKLD